jgi:putative sigma-54 modulation protein
MFWVETPDFSWSIGDSCMMMPRLSLHGRNIELTASIKSAVFEKLDRIFAHFDFIQSVNVHLSVQKNPRISDAHVAEVLIHVNGGLFKVEATSESLYTALDLLVTKMMRSLTKYKSKNLGRQKSARSQGGETLRSHGLELVAPLQDPKESYFVELDLMEENEAAAFAEAEVHSVRYA